MSKTVIILVILAVIVGVAIGWHYGFSPLQIIQELIQNPTEILPKIWAFVKQNWQILTGAISGLFGTLALAAKAYSQHKQETQDNLNQIKSDATARINELTTEKENMQTQVTQTTEQFTTLQGQLLDANNLNADLTAERDGLQKQLRDTITYKDSEIRDLKAKLAKAEAYA